MFGWDDGPDLTPHGFCLLWEPGLIWLDVVSDLATAVAYFSIPVSLAVLAKGRRAGAHSWLAWLFGGFILACGGTHVMSVVTLWWPLYWSDGALKALTALLSIATAISLWPIVPKVLAMPSRGAMEDLTTELQRQIAAHEETNARLHENEARLEAAQRRLSERIEEKAYRLQVADEQQRALFENSPDALYVIRIDGDPATRRFVFETVNPVFEQLVGHPLGELSGRDVTAFLGAAEAAELTAALSRCVGDRTVVTFSVTRTSTEREIELETSLAPVTDPRSGAISRIVGVVRDVTQRRLLERQVLHMQKIEVTGRLTAGVAHDFNNILQALMGGLEILTDSLAGRQRDFAEMALRSAERGAELTHRLLAFCRQQVLSPRAVDLGEILRSVCSLLGGSLTPGVTLKVEVPDPPIPALVDVAQLEAALLNLLVNAGDATSGAGTITLSAEQAKNPAPLDLAPGEWAVVAVTDTGSGMDEAVLRQACDPFFTTKGPRGSGLGLSMVQGFVRQSGGEMRITSRPGFGTRVELWLPRTTVQLAPWIAPDAEAPVVEHDVGHLLLVDDSEDVLAATAAHLTSAGFSVTRAASGGEAMGLIASGLEIDGLITDYAMPGMTGTELVRRARTLRPDLPALMITGFGEIASGGLAKVRVLRKPFSRRTLVAEADRIVKQAVAGRRAMA